jgi:hypothetical protein
LLEIEREFPPKTIEAYVGNWRKFMFVCKLFCMSMVGIVEKWENGSLQSTFRPNEIQRWIRALFSASPFREKNIAKIK